MKQIRGTPKHGGRVCRQSPRVQGGWLPPENILSRHFETYLHDMDLKLIEHVRNTISFFISKETKKKPSEISIFRSFFAKKINFGENRHFRVSHVSLRHCDVIRWPIFMILVSVERGSTVVPKNYTLGVSIWSSQEWLPCYKKGSRRQGLIFNTFDSVVVS